MAEHCYTYYLKKNLAERLGSFIKDETEYDYLAVETEYRQTTIYGENRIDIAIYDEDDLDKMVGIEIESLSSKAQISVNYNKFRGWVHASPKRTGGLLHIISSESNISIGGVKDLLIGSYVDTNKNKGFYYEFFKFDIGDYRKTSQSADYLVYEDWEFEVRLFSLLENVFG